MSMNNRIGRLAVVLAGASLVAACAGIRDQRGFILDKQLTEAIQVGVDNKDSVARTLGRPTFVGQFNPNDWYYTNYKTRQVAFSAPKVREATILHIRFDQAGNVALVQTADESRIARVDPMGGKTPTLGYQKSIIEEIFGNIGSISQPGLPGSSPQ